MEEAAAQLAEYLTEHLLTLWQGLIYPLLRLLLIMSGGLLLAGLVEALRWTRHLARLTAPLLRLSGLGEIAAASFSLAFVSPASANALLSESLCEKKISRREAILANLFNSSPSFFVHLPSMLALTISFLGAPGLFYTGISFLAACLRTLITAAAGRILLPAPAVRLQIPAGSPEKNPAKRELARKIWRRFKSRIRKILFFTVPVYILVYAMQCLGLFDLARDFLAGRSAMLSFLNPEALSIVALSLSAELGAALSASAALHSSAGLDMREIILALLVGNILSTPIRAFKHQLPAYAGFYSPGLALQLVSINQSLRALTMLLLTAAYYAATCRLS